MFRRRDGLNSYLHRVGAWAELLHASRLESEATVYYTEFSDCGTVYNCAKVQSWSVDYLAPVLKTANEW